MKVVIYPLSTLGRFDTKLYYFRKMLKFSKKLFLPHQEIVVKGNSEYFRNIPIGLKWKFSKLINELINYSMNMCWKKWPRYYDIQIKQFVMAKSANNHFSSYQVYTKLYNKFHTTFSHTSTKVLKGGDFLLYLLLEDQQ